MEVHQEKSNQILKRSYLQRSLPEYTIPAVHGSNWVALWLSQIVRPKDDTDRVCAEEGSHGQPGSKEKAAKPSQPHMTTPLTLGPPPKHHRVSYHINPLT